MKKIVLVCIGVMMLFSFASCNGGMPTGVSYENVGHGLIKLTAGTGSAPIVAWKAKQKAGENTDGTDKTEDRWCSTYYAGSGSSATVPVLKREVFYIPISDLLGKDDSSVIRHPYGDISEMVLSSVEGDCGLLEAPIFDKWSNSELVDCKLNSDCTKFELSEFGKRKGLKVGQSFSIDVTGYNNMSTRITAAKAADPVVDDGKVTCTVEVKKDGTDAPDYYAAIVPEEAFTPYSFMDKAAYKLDASGKFEAEVACSDVSDFRSKYNVFVFGCDDSDKKKAATNVRWVAPKMAVPESMRGKWTCSPDDGITITLECTEDSIYLTGEDTNTDNPEWKIAVMDLLAQYISGETPETGETFRFYIDDFEDKEHGELNYGNYVFTVSGDTMAVTLPNDSTTVGNDFNFTKSAT